MYKVIVVDDEPAAVNLISNIIKKKCTSFEVSEVAYNGQAALEKMYDNEPDLVLTDVRMPGMDGIKLLKHIRERFPELSVIILSGYSEFEYAKSAISYGVEDYILKPLDIPEFLEMMKKVQEKLDKKFYRVRNQLVSTMINGEQKLTEKSFKAYFQNEKYYMAMWRDNGLPGRFYLRKKEIFSENSPVIVYGRDEMEGIILCPESVVINKDFASFYQRFSARYQDLEAKYRTAIVFQKPCKIEELQKNLKILQRMLNERAVIGYSQTVVVEDMENEQSCICEGTRLSGDAEKIIKAGSIENIEGVLTKYIFKWGRDKCPELWVESQIRHIFYQIEKRKMLELEHNTIEYLLEDIFFEAANMDDLLQGLISILEENKKNRKGDDFLERERIFVEVREYLENNLKEQISVPDVCMKFGISKATLSKVFHENAECSFHNYFILLRIERAKEYMKSDKNSLIKDVAQAVGYADQFYFSRIFKTITGISPSEYITKDEKWKL